MLISKVRARARDRLRDRDRARARDRLRDRDRDRVRARRQGQGEFWVYNKKVCFRVIIPFRFLEVTCCLQPLLNLPRTHKNPQGIWGIAMNSSIRPGWLSALVRCYVG